MVPILGLCLVMFSYALTVSFRSRSVTALVQRSVFDDVCEVYARMATVETLRILRETANQVGQPSFELLRQEAPAATSFDLSGLPLTQAEMALTPAYSLEGGVEVQVLRRSPVSTRPWLRSPYDAFGVLRISAKVRGPKRSRAKLTYEYGFRSALAGTPRPMDTATFMLLQIDPLLEDRHYQGHANRAIELAQSKVPQIQEGFQGLAQSLSQALPQISQAVPDLEAARANLGSQEAAQVGPLLDQLIAHFTRSEAGFQAWIEAFQGASDGIPKLAEVHLFAPGMSAYSLSPEVDLRALHLPERVEPGTQELKTLVDPYDASQPELVVALEGYQASLEALSQAVKSQAIQSAAQAQGYLTQMEAALTQIEAKAKAHQELGSKLAQALAELTAIYADWQGLLVEVGGDAQAKLYQRIEGLAGDELRRKAHLVFSGPDAGARAKAHLASGRPFQGVLYIENSKPFEVDLEGFEGRVLLATRGDMIVRKAQVQDPAQDSITLVSYGALEVPGVGVQASLIPAGGNFRGPTAGFTGNLILVRAQRVDFDSIFRGKLSFQEALRTSEDAAPGAERAPPRPETLRLRISPSHLYRQVER